MLPAAIVEKPHHNARHWVDSQNAVTSVVELSQLGLEAIPNLTELKSQP